MRIKVFAISFVLFVLSFGVTCFAVDVPTNSYGYNYYIEYEQTAVSDPNYYRRYFVYSQNPFIVDATNKVYTSAGYASYMITSRTATNYPATPFSSGTAGIQVYTIGSTTYPINIIQANHVIDYQTTGEPYYDPFPYPSQNDLSAGNYNNGFYIYSPRDNEIMMDNTIYKFKANFKYDLPITMNNYTISDNDRIFVNNVLDSQILNTLEVYFTDSDGNMYPANMSNLTVNQSDYLRPMVTNEYTDPPMDGVIEGYMRSPYNIDETYTLHARVRPYSSINFKNGQIGSNNISINSSNVQILETEIAINVQEQSQVIDSNGDLIEDNTNDVILPPVTNIIINNNNTNGDGYVPTPIIVPEVPTINNTNLSVILDGLTNFFGENGFFTSISAFFGELLSWLPMEVRLVLGGATTLVAILLIVKVIRG